MRVGSGYRCRRRSESALARPLDPSRSRGKEHLLTRPLPEQPPHLIAAGDAPPNSSPGQLTGWGASISAKLVSHEHARPRRNEQILASSHAHQRMSRRSQHDARVASALYHHPGQLTGAPCCRIRSRAEPSPKPSPRSTTALNEFESVSDARAVAHEASPHSSPVSRRPRASRVG